MSPQVQNRGISCSTNWTDVLQKCKRKNSQESHVWAFEGHLFRDQFSLGRGLGPLPCSPEITCEHRETDRLAQGLLPHDMAVFAKPHVFCAFCIFFFEVFFSDRSRISHRGGPTLKTGVPTYYLANFFPRKLHANKRN